MDTFTTLFSYYYYKFTFYILTSIFFNFYYLELVPPPLGVQIRNASQKKINTEITNIIMNLHTNIHSTPYSATSVESFEILVALAARKFDEKATVLPKNAVGIRAGIADAISKNKKHLNAGWTGGEYLSEGAAREWSTVVIVKVIFMS